MNKEQRLKKRHNAEKRFRLYGLASVLLAIFFVFFLLNAIFSKGKISHVRVETGVRTLTVLPVASLTPTQQPPWESALGDG